jgi:hypothetical protein
MADYETLLVTGGSRGIGAAAAILAAERFIPRGLRPGENLIGSIA